MILSEVTVLFKVKHQHALQVIEVFETQSEILIVTQLYGALTLP
jgi:hypothetical protein